MPPKIIFHVYDSKSKCVLQDFRIKILFLFPNFATLYKKMALFLGIRKLDNRFLNLYNMF